MSLLLFVTAVALRSTASFALQQESAADLTGSPLSKVVALLKDMAASLAKDATTDAELYEKLSCWCTTTGGEKTAAIKTAGERISTLTANIEQFSAKSAELKAEMTKLGKEIAKNEASIQKATGLREKEHGEFSSDEKELVDSLQSVSAAVDTLQKHHSSFLQLGAGGVKVAVAAVLKRHADVVRPSQKKVLEGFLQEKQMPSGGSYNSRSGAIFGILNQMKETFESNLSQSQKEEMQAQREFDALVAAKTREVNAAKAAVVAKTKELAETDEAKVHAKHDLAKTRDALSADSKFLLDLQARCDAADAEYAERTKMRNEELAGVSDAMAILSDDESRDLFSSTFAFVQVDSAPQRAAKLLRKAGIQSKNTALVALSTTVVATRDSFHKVKKAIDDMVGDLKKQMQDEVEQAKFCESELASNDKGQAEANKNVNDLTVSLADMAAQVDTLSKEIAALQAEVAETNTAIKRASEDREAENAEFQQTVRDQRATQTILAKVLARLGKVYQKTALVQHEKQVATRLLQQEPGAAAPPAPAGFKEYKQAPAGGVMALIQKVADEANTLEKEALHAEQTAQTAYQEFVNDAAAAVNAANRSLSAKSSQKAQLNSQTVAETADRKANLGALEHLGRVAGKLHLSCDFVQNNFDARQAARGEEIDALNSAKAILSGATFS